MAPAENIQLLASEPCTHRHMAANVSRGNIPAEHVATLPPDEEEEFIVKREREAAKNEVFLNLKISTESKRGCINTPMLYSLPNAFLFIISK
jgi:hypothetical protein